MNKSYLFKTMAAFFAFAVIISCSNESTDSNGGGDDPVELTAITLSSSIQSAIIELDDPFQFTVTGNDNGVYTSTSALFVNGTQISNIYYTPSEIGSYEVYATVNGLTSNTITLQADSGVTSIDVTAASFNDIGSDIALTAKNNLNFNITDDVTFYVNGNAIAGNIYNTNVLGTYDVYATYQNPLNNEDFQSPAVSFEVLDIPEFSQKVLVEDYTGTWCGYCPRLAYNLEEAEMQDSRVVGVGVHSGDVMETSATNPMESAYGVNGWPDGKINRNLNWNESISQVLSYVGDEADLGLAINSTLNGSTISVDVKINYAAETSGNKLVVYLLEDGLLYNQANYMNGDPNSPWYQAGDPIVDFEHNNVLRMLFTDVFGDTIPDGTIATVDTNNFSAPVPSTIQDTNNLEIVAFVIGSNGTVINTQHAALGENKDFD